MDKESLTYCLLESLLRQGKKGAICLVRGITTETEMSYLELHRDSNRMANSFLNLGIKKGDRAIIYLKKSLGLVVAYLALQKIGAVAVPLNPGFKKSEMSYLVKNSEPELVLLGPEQERTVKAIMPDLTAIVIPEERPYRGADFFRNASDALPPVDIQASDPALIVYTSGTTGRPKGVVLTQGNLLHDARKIVKAWNITEADVLCHALPLFHVHGLCFALHTVLMAGGRVLLLDKFSPENVIGALSRKGGEFACTLFMAVPTMYREMMDYLEGKNIDFNHVRLWTSGSAPLPARDFDRIKRVFSKEPVEREGMSETGMNFSNPLEGIRRPGSIGLAMPDLEVRIVDPATSVDVEPGETGEIWLRGPGITPGYWRDPAQTAMAFEKGWFRTGDLGRVDGEGYYYLTDRIKHIIISGGENISPKEVASVINGFEDVVESCVVGVPDKKWGEKVVAAVVMRPGSAAKPHDIQEFCKKHLHKWKCPKKILFVKVLPKNKMGKILIEETKKFFRPGFFFEV